MRRRERIEQVINLTEELKGVRTVAIAGHIRPDGDAIGSCLGLFWYIKENMPEISAVVYLENVPENFSGISGFEEISSDYSADLCFDLMFCLDCSDEERLGPALKYKESAKRSLCVDHHISNAGFADENYIVPTASSTSELIFTLLDEDKIPFHAAEALYMGIAHDTGVFRHSSTSPETMEIAAKLMRQGINFNKIINTTYFNKSYHQLQILGRALLESIRLLDGKIIFSVVRAKDMDFYGVTSSDLDGIVETLMGTTGVEAAIFLYETKFQEYKVSMRSGEKIDVSMIASYFGGGGHVRAAGCTMQGNFRDVVNNITEHMEKQLKMAGD